MREWAPRTSSAIAALQPEAQDILKHAITTLNSSARADNRALKVARTIADLAGSDTVREEDVAEALQYRSGKLGRVRC